MAKAAITQENVQAAYEYLFDTGEYIRVGEGWQELVDEGYFSDDVSEIVQIALCLYEEYRDWSRARLEEPGLLHYDGISSNTSFVPDDDESIIEEAEYAGWEPEEDGYSFDDSEDDGEIIPESYEAAE